MSDLIHAQAIQKELDNTQDPARRKELKEQLASAIKVHWENLELKKENEQLRIQTIIAENL